MSLQARIAQAPSVLPPLLVLFLAKARRLRGIEAFREYSGPLPCRLCGGTGRRACTTCAGRGVLEKGGFARRNPIRSLDSLVGSKWTSTTAIGGKWRHFICVGRKGRTTRTATAQLSSTCGPRADRLAIDVPVSELRNRGLWTGGWTTLADIAKGAKPTPCSACSGKKIVACPRCDGLGQVGL